MPANSKKLRLLHIEDSPADAERVRVALETGDFQVEVHRVESEADVIAALQQGGWNVIISDYDLPQFNATHVLKLLSDRRHEVPFIVTSGDVGEEIAVSVIKAGATDFVTKSNLARLPAAIERGLRESATRKAHRLATAALLESEAHYRAITQNIPGMVYQSLVGLDGKLEITYASEQCRQLFGIEAEALMANPALGVALVDPEDAESFQSVIKKVSHDLSNTNWEGRIRVPEGDIKWINLRASHRLMPTGQILSEGIFSNISLSKVLQKDLERSQEESRLLSSHLQRVKEQERAHMARELHDVLGGTLTAIKIDLLRLHSGLPEARSDLVQKIKSASGLLDHAMDTVRNVSQNLRPGILDYGLQAAIEWQTREFGERLGIKCELHCNAENLSLDADAITALFRIFQETLTNISKHADASEVTITLAEDGETVFLEVTDNGGGVAESDLNKPGSFGIRNIRERVEALQGDFEIVGTAGTGTRVFVTIPSLVIVTEPEEKDIQRMLF